MDCKTCGDLWETYRSALMEHVRISGKFKLEVLIGDPAAIERIRAVMLVAEAGRQQARERYVAHQNEHTMIQGDSLRREMASE